MTPIFPRKRPQLSVNSDIEQVAEAVISQQEAGGGSGVIMSQTTVDPINARAIVQAKRDEVNNHMSLDRARRFYALGLLDEILAQLPE